MQNYQIIKKIYESANSLVYQVVQKKRQSTIYT